ncbi:hypothetical protein GF352_01490 [archaeon]|nr:hypothetical protein [archaeon]
MVKVTRKDEELIDEFAKTKTVREVARVVLSYLTVEEMAQFVSTYLVFKSKDLEDKVLGYFVKDQFFPLVKTGLMALGDLIPDFVTDTEFMKLYAKLPKKLDFKKD